MELAPNIAEVRSVVLIGSGGSSCATSLTDWALLRLAKFCPKSRGVIGEARLSNELLYLEAAFRPK